MGISGHNMKSVSVSEEEHRLTIQLVFGKDEELSVLRFRVVGSPVSSLTKVGASQEASGETPHYDEEKERKELKATSIVPGVIRHTSQPNTSLAYYYSYK